MFRSLTSCLAVVALWPSLAMAESDPCAGGEPDPPTLHATNQPTATDSLIAIGPPYEVSGVSLRDASGQEIAVTRVWNDRTRNSWAVYEPAEALTPGDYALHVTQPVPCENPREVVLPIVVDEREVEPIAAMPQIANIEATLIDGQSLKIDVHVERPAPGTPPGWVLVDAPLPAFESLPVDSLIDVQQTSHATLDRVVTNGDQLDEVCVEATFYDLAGRPGPTTESCTTEFERIDTAQDDPFGSPLSCSVQRNSPPGWAMAALLGVVLVRRRRHGA